MGRGIVCALMRHERRTPGTMPVRIVICTHHDQLVQLGGPPRGGQPPRPRSIHDVEAVPKLHRDDIGYSPPTESSRKIPLRSVRVETRYGGGNKAIKSR
jgi:hypothetical protein